MNYPSFHIIQQLNKDSTFESYFKNLYEIYTYKEIIQILQSHPIFKKRKLSNSRIHELKTFYKLKSKMHEEIYNSDYDRIRGYIIRGLKGTAKARGIYFDLTYKDLELPEYCPLLGLKLKYGNTVNYNSPEHSSVDRIDNSKGYIKGNVMVMSKLANSMKNSASLEQLETFSQNCLKLITQYKNQI